MAKTAAQRQADYRLRHPERAAAAKREYRARCKEKIAASRRLYYEKNRVSILKKTRMWRATRRSYLLAYSREYERTHQKERRIKYLRDKNSPQRLASQQAWRKRHPEAWKLIVKRGKAIRRARLLQASGRLPRRAIAARLAYYGWRCWICGAPWSELDHVIPLARGGTNWPANIRPACRTCNRRKGARRIA